MKLREKNGRWILKMNGKAQNFATEEEALAAAGVKQALDISKADINHDGMITREEVLTWLDENEEEDDLKG